MRLNRLCLAVIILTLVSDHETDGQSQPSNVNRKSNDPNQQPKPIGHQTRPLAQNRPSYVNPNAQQPNHHGHATLGHQQLATVDSSVGTVSDTMSQNQPQTADTQSAALPGSFLEGHHSLSRHNLVATGHQGGRWPDPRPPPALAVYYRHRYGHKEDKKCKCDDHKDDHKVRSVCDKNVD